jgi:hypothetical protein
MGNESVLEYRSDYTVLLEKLTITQLVKKYSPFYGTWKFITVFPDPYPESVESS